ncbi:MAG: LysR family transcriptional regulator [Parvularculaceae bacterium]|nr:LysR family transcriptional regulator [Parvularculaceae bacterium]
MEMQQIRYFLAVAETLNFTRAAENCNVSQPALTRAIQALEAELGGPLINRERQNTHLSELGRMMLPYFESIKRQTATAVDTARSFAKLEQTTLTIGVMCTIGPAIIANFLQRFSIAHPEIEINICVSPLKNLQKGLLEGDYEVGFLASPDAIDEGLHTLPLFSERFMLVVPKTHRLANAEAVPCKELDGERYINRTNCEYYDYVHDQFISQGIRTKRIFSSESDGWVLGMIRAGLGFGYFPEFAVEDRDVITKPLVAPEFARTIQFTTVRGRPHSPAVGALVRQARLEQWPAQTERHSRL